jgi:hypothetical protein
VNLSGHEPLKGGMIFELVKQFVSSLRSAESRTNNFTGRNAGSLGMSGEASAKPIRLGKRFNLSRKQSQATDPYHSMLAFAPSFLPPVIRAVDFLQ